MQALVEKLVASGTLTTDDLVNMPKCCLSFAANVGTAQSRGSGNDQVGLRQQIVEWWDRVNTLALHVSAR